ncbi:uncharacterized protein LOC135121719 [Zophobas morio]|uniref:uncharacterized protein LOC135121719 n=1 Tax=Zophobas morio TaxID=2755281 RepID=UPI0030832234
MANYGHFSLAEVLIHGATAMIESVEGSDSTKLLNSRIRLATIFLSSGQYDRAISVIEALLLASVPAHCRAHFELLLLLSEALIKHDWLRESHEVLGLFPRNKRTLGGPCGHVHSYKSLQQTPEDEPDDDFYETFECARYNRKLVIKEELQNVSRDLLFKFWCLCGKSLLKNNECLRAFDAYNEALAFCSKENLSQSGQVFYKKGKVLHALLQTNSRCVMPLVIREGKEECKIKSFSEV